MKQLRRCIWPIVVACFLAILCVSCIAAQKPSKGDEMSNTSDFQVRYIWREGSLPPPYYFEYTIQIGPGVQGTIEFQPDYPFNDPPIWVEELTLSPQQISDLYDLMKEKQVFTREWNPVDEPSVGGGVQWIEGVANGQRFSVPEQLSSSDAKEMAEVYSTIRSMAPASIWSTLLTRQKEYQEEYLQKH